MDEKFLNYLKQNGRVTVAQVQKDFGIDYVSARKKLQEFENSGIVEIQGPWFVYTRSGDNTGKTGEKHEEEQTAKADEAPGPDSDDADGDFLEERKRILRERLRMIAEREALDDKKDSEDEENEDNDDSGDRIFRDIERAKADRANRFVRYTGSDADDDENEELNKFLNLFPDGEDNQEIPQFIRSVQAGANTRRNRLIIELDRLCSIDDSEVPDLEEKRKAVIAELKDAESFAALRGAADESFFTGNRGYIICQVEDIRVARGSYRDDLKLELRYPDDTPYEISLVFDHFLTDNGKTFAYIADKIDLTEEEVVAEIKAVASFYSVEIVDGVLYKSLEDPAKALLELMRFAVAIDEISMCRYKY